MARSEDKQKQIKELLLRADAGTKEVFTSDKYKKYLTTMAKFHNYSFRNTLLILMQKPAASYVAGYKAWQTKFKRQVLRGEKGIQIVGYTPKKVQVQEEKKDQYGSTVYGPNGRPETISVTKQVPAFAPVYVYDISQTTGEPLPRLVNELDGSVTGYNNLMAALRDVSPFPIEFEKITNGSKGYADIAEKRIAINEGMSEKQTVKTAIHEITHADLHAPERSNYTMSDRPDRLTREVEAESTAFVVCAHYGIDTSDYSFPYLAAWSSNKELKELQGSLDTIQKQASDLIDRIDSRLSELQKEQSISQEVPTPASEKLLEKENNNTYSNNLEQSHDHSAEERRRADEMLDTVRHDNDIDLDREKTRDQLGFHDNKDTPHEKMSMKDRFAAARDEADQRATARLENNPQREQQKNGREI